MALMSKGYGYDYNRYNRFRSERFPSEPQSFSSGAGPSKLGPTPRFRPSAPQRGGLSSRFYGSRTREGVLSTGFGSSRPKLLSMRRVTSKWLPPSRGRGLLQPNPSYMGGAGGFDYRQASRMGMGRMPRLGTYGSQADMPFMRPTV